MQRSAIRLSAALLRHQGNATVFSDISTISHFQIPQRSHLTTVIALRVTALCPACCPGTHKAHL